MQPNNVMEDPRRLATEYVVEATSTEAHALWREHSREAQKNDWGSPQTQRVAWKQDPDGWMHQVGELAGFPVNIEVHWARIGGALIMFWSSCSRVVDWEMCEAWLRQNVPAYAERQTNATNFGHVLGWLAHRQG